MPVLILGNSQLVLHHGTLGIIRTLGRMNVPVYCVIRDRLTPAAVSRYLTGAFVWNTGALNRQSFLDGMRDICQRLPCPAVLIPTDDVSAILIAECAEVLKSHFLFSHQPPELTRTLADKKELYLLCERIGVSYPRTFYPNSLADVDNFVSKAKFPVVVKAAKAWALPKGQLTTTVVRNPDQLYEIYKRVETGQTQNILFQEYIPPDYGEDWFYHGYRNTESNCCFGFTGQKLRSYPPLAGPTTLGKAVENESLRKTAEQLLESISYSGIMDLDYRFDKRDGKYKLLDFNPRIGAQFRLFEDNLGIDVVRAFYLDLTGKGLPEFGAMANRTFIAEFHELAAEISYLFGGLAPRDWSSFPGGKREWAWSCYDDPFPFLMMCVRLLGRVAEKSLRVSANGRTASNVPRYVTTLSSCLSRNGSRPPHVPPRPL